MADLLISDALIDEATMMAKLGYDRRSDLVKCLRRHKIQFIRGHEGRICCTITAIDRALGGEQNAESDNFEP